MTFRHPSEPTSIVKLFTPIFFGQSGSSVSETNKETNLGDKIDGSEVPGSGKGPLAVASILGAVLLFSLTRFGGDGVDLKSLAATAIPYDEVYDFMNAD